jgi:hypothetical protein
MAGKAGLKAGLIGLAIMLVMSLVNHLLPIAGNTVLMLAICGIDLAIYAGIGVLAGIFLPPPRSPGKGAGAGAIAGLIGGIVVGVVGFIMVVTGVSTIPSSPQMQQAIEPGLDPMTTVAVGAVCNPLLGAGLAATGGAILAAVKPD